MRYDLIALGLLFVAILVWMQRRQAARAAASRSDVFRSCLDLFETVHLSQGDGAFPSLSGRYRGREIRLELLVDTLGFRKLPPLWLMLTVPERLPFRGTLDILMRPQGSEFWSPGDRLDHPLAIPAGWPQHAAIRSDRPDAMPPLAAIERHLGLFGDPRVKELLIGPGGLRLVWQANQGRSAHYLVLRQAEFETLELERESLRNLLDRALFIHGDLAPNAPAPRQAGALHVAAV
jgi:hypothetical protein